MNGRRAVALCSLVAAAVLLLSTAGAYSQMESSRGVAVAVADDENALLEVGTVETGGENGSSFELIEFHNNFGQELTVTSVSTDSDLITVEGSDDPRPVPSDGHGDVTVSATCEAVGSQDVEVTVRAEGNSVEVRTRKTIEVDCTPRSTPEPADTPRTTPEQ